MYIYLGQIKPGFSSSYASSRVYDYSLLYTLDLFQLLTSLYVYSVTWQTLLSAPKVRMYEEVKARHYSVLNPLPCPTYRKFKVYNKLT